MDKNMSIIEAACKNVCSHVLIESIQKHVVPKIKDNYVVSKMIEEAIARLSKTSICLTEDQYLENLDWAAKSYRAALKKEPVPCRGCKQGFELIKLFRCYHCGSYFCPNCARDHFGERDGRLFESVLKANKEVA